MERERIIWERARLARDARFDGRFFIGVVTTGIYCRPICPVAAPKPAHVRYFPSAAAAAAAGFRPCLRCRPEASPGTPAWLGSSATVSRALRLISGGALDTGSVEAMAARLGIGGRQLRRLFLRHLGATPVAIAQTRRLQFAKKLIDETRLPLTQVAYAAGFRSIRRFNASFRALYGRPPRELRHLGVHGSADPAEPDEYRFRLSFRPPYDWDALISFLRPRATPGVETVTDCGYRRTFSFDGAAGFFEVRPVGGRACLEARIHFPDPRALLSILERIRRIFDLGADPGEISRHLRRDPWLRRSVVCRSGLRVPGAWDGFELAVRAVLGQQVAVKAATTLAGRVVEAWGRPTDHGALFPTAAVLAEADYRQAGLTERCAQTLRALARATCRGEIPFDGAGDLDAFLHALSTIPGIGPWTAHYVAMRALGEPDAFPVNDLVLLRTAAARGCAGARALSARAEAWRPWRAYAAMHLWAEASESASAARPCRESQRSRRRIS